MRALERGYEGARERLRTWGRGVRAGVVYLGKRGQGKERHTRTARRKFALPILDCTNEVTVEITVACVTAAGVIISKVLLCIVVATLAAMVVVTGAATVVTWAATVVT